jgi:hypothetical protein
MEDKNNLETILEKTDTKETKEELICNYCYETIKGTGYKDPKTNNHYCNQTHYNANYADDEDDEYNENHKNREDCDDE